MAIIKQLTDLFKTSKIYPITVLNAIFDSNGNRMSDYVNSDAISSEEPGESVEDVSIVADRIGKYTAVQVGEFIDNFDDKVCTYLDENPETEFLNVKKTGAKGDGITDDSACFVDGVAGYVVNDGIYCVDATTMAKLNSKNCIGNGYLRLYGPNYNVGESDTAYAPLDYIIEVKDLDNNLKKILASGSEAEYFMPRTYCTRGLKPLEGACNAHTIGAIYKVKDAEIPDNITICLGKVAMFVLLKDGVWRKLADDNYPAGYGLFELPWVPETTRTLDSSKVIRHKDYIEYRLTKEDFSGLNEGKTEAVLHFWGSDGYIEDRDNIVGIISAFDFWVKEPEAQDKFVATIGVDQIDTATKTIKQGFSGIAMKIKTYPRTQWGTTMNRELIDSCCDFSYIQHMYNVSSQKNVVRYEKHFNSSYKSLIASSPNGDVYYRVNDDIASDEYRNYFSLNPIKHLYLPYHGSSDVVTGNYCKLFSFPVTNNVNRFTFRINYYNYVNANTPIIHLDAIVEIHQNCTVQITNIGTHNASVGLITIVKNNTEICVYVKSATWTHTIVDIEYLTYSNATMLSHISFDTDLLRVGAGSYNVSMEKWVSIDTTDCTVVESSIAVNSIDSDTLNTRLTEIFG